MLDTLNLYLPDVRYSSKANLTVQPSAVNLQTGERSKECQLLPGVFGAKAYLNTDKLNFQITAVGRDGEYHPLSHVHFSVPKVYSGSDENVMPCDEGQTLEAVRKVQDELESQGVVTDLVGTGEISRIDTFVNVQTDEPFQTYDSVFQLLQARQANQRDYGTTYLVHNRSQEFCVYDKVQELQNRHLNTDGMPELVRFEHRLLKKRKVESLLGFSSVSDMFDGGWAVIRDKRRLSWEESLFRYDPAEFEHLASSEILSMMQAYFDTGTRNWFSQYWKHFGMITAIQKFGFEVIEDAIWRCGIPPRTAYRYVKELQKLDHGHAMSEMITNTKTMGELYSELKRKVLESDI